MENVEKTTQTRVQPMTKLEAKFQEDISVEEAIQVLIRDRAFILSVVNGYPDYVELIYAEHKLSCSILRIPSSGKY
jgi:hypothetical protein